MGLRINQESLRSILAAAWAKRKSYIEAGGFSVYRLVTKEEMGWKEGTGLSVAVDIYKGVVAAGLQNEKSAIVCAVVQVYDASVWESAGLVDLEKVLRSDFQVEQVFYKRRFRVKEAVDAGGELMESPLEMVVQENGLKFLVNLNNYLDTGLFLDHREARLWTRKYIEKKRQTVQPKADVNFTVLNLFAYTGSFSVYAAAGGAQMTHTVDLSKTYCEWARRNFELNGMARENHWIYRMDIFEFYKYAARKKLQFDLIILDPPTFSRNKGSNLSVQRDHFELIAGAATFLKPAGEILFSNNCLDFVMDSRVGKDYSVTNLQNKTVPIDFWVDPKLAGWDYVPQIHNSFLIRLK